MIRTAAAVSVICAHLLFAQTGPPPVSPGNPGRAANPVISAASGGDEIVTIERLTVKGSRLTTPSIQYLSGLRPGMKVNEASVRRAAQRIAESGLVKNVGYQYQSLSSERSVELEFTISDELPLLPASIQIPDVDAEDVWAYLHGIAPLYTHELPRTQKAIALYTRAMERYFASQKQMVHVATVITADGKGNASGIVFVPASLLGTPQLQGTPQSKGVGALPGAKP